VESTLAPRRPPWLLALADALAIVVFATVGLISHDHGLSATGYARDALPILGAWFAVALGLRIYVVQRPRRVLATWAIAVPVGVLIRALVLGRDLNGKEAVFLLVSLVTILIFVVVLRALLALTPPARRVRHAGP
jgi:hypothetical protein